MSSENSEILADEVRSKLVLSDEELLAEIGQSLGKGATFTDAVKRGRQVFDNLMRNLKTDVCTSPKVIASYREARSDNVLVIASIVDAITGAVLHGFPPANIAILIYRAGLTGYCGPNWPPQA